MNYEISDMDINDLKNYARLFTAVFNEEPWNDRWTEETATIRIENVMNTKTFTGKALYFENDLKGFIYGQREQYYDGVRFQLLEFCVKNTEQGSGYGKALLEALEKELKEAGIVKIYLMTIRGEKTEGYYKKRGYALSDSMIIMEK